MRTLLFVAGLLAALLAGAWFVAASRIESQAEAALLDLEAQGWEVDHADLSVTGFPSRFDAGLTDLRLASPDGNVVWEAPSFRVRAASYRPNRVVAVWPEEQRLTVRGQTVDVASEDLRASATVGLSPDLPLRGAALDSGPVRAEAEGGWQAALGRLLASARHVEGGAYDVHLEIEDLAIPGLLATVSLVRLDAQVTLDRPFALRDGTAPNFRGIVLRDLRLVQGDVALTGTGQLAPDAQGYLSGTLTLAAENWRGLLDLLESAGVLVYDQRSFLERALDQLAQGRDRIEVPVTFADGQVEALGLGLLEAPRVP